MSDEENKVPEKEPTTQEFHGEKTIEEPVLDEPKSDPESEGITPTDDLVLPKQNVTFGPSPFSPIDSLKHNGASVNLPLILPNQSMAELENSSKNLPEIDYQMGSEGQIWTQTVTSAQQHYMTRDIFGKLPEREGSDWRQDVTCDGERIVPGKPRHEITNGAKLSGELASMKVRAIMGLGSLVTIQLWHTGLWVSIKAPTDASLLELTRRLSEETTLLGRRTNGMIFSNDMTYVTEAVVDFAINHIYESTLADFHPDSFKEVLLATDIQTLVWGLLCAAYPNGHQYSSPCINNPGNCHHVFKEVISFTKMLFVDNAHLTQSQLRHMKRRNARYTVAEIKAYQEEHVRGAASVRQISDNLAIKLSVPTAADSFQAGRNWITDVEAMMEEVFQKRGSASERESYINEQGALARLRNYGQWISEIQVISGDNVETIEDRETIDEVLDTLSENTGLSTRVWREVESYIADSTIVFIGHHNLPCPVCGSHQVPEEVKEKRVIVVDIVAVFFTLRALRLLKLSALKSGRGI